MLSHHRLLGLWLPGQVIISSQLAPEESGD